MNGVPPALKLYWVTSFLRCAEQATVAQVCNHLWRTVQEVDRGCHGPSHPACRLRQEAKCSFFWHINTAVAFPRCSQRLLFYANQVLQLMKREINLKSSDWSTSFVLLSRNRQRSLIVTFTGHLISMSEKQSGEDVILENDGSPYGAKHLVTLLLRAPRPGQLTNPKNWFLLSRQERFEQCKRARVDNSSAPCNSDPDQWLTLQLSSNLLRKAPFLLPLLNFLCGRTIVLA